MMPIIRPTLPELREVEELVRASWDEGLVTSGFIVRAFEDEVCRQTGTTHAVAVASCTAGLMLAAQAMEFPAGSAVIVPSFTFAAADQALVWNGLVPVFCECLPGSLTLDPDDVERNLSPRTAREGVSRGRTFAGLACTMIAGSSTDTPIARFVAQACSGLAPRSQWIPEKNPLYRRRSEYRWRPGGVIA